MDAGRIRELLQPFFRGAIGEISSLRATPSPEDSADLATSQSENISNYLDLLLLWNARVNLTSLRESEEIVTRHFGESLFAARQLFPDADASRGHVIDVGSGAGFPGLPVKIWVPAIRLTMIESNHKKATFLREVVRRLGLTNVEVFAGRAEDYDGQADIVTLRAVERFEQAVSIAARLVTPGGRLALLIGEGQVKRARDLTPSFEWNDPAAIPLSLNRVLLLGRSPESRNHG
jgi:16S rRNA (guanine527-N7)-methyltransferase